MDPKPEWLSKMQEGTQAYDQLADATARFRDISRPSDLVLDRSIQVALEKFQEANPAVEKQLDSFRSAMLSATSASRDLVEQQFKFAAEFSEAMSTLARLPNIDLEAIWQNNVAGARELAARGWFLCHDWSPAYYYGRCFALIRTGKWEECEQLLEDHYEEILPELRGELSREFPHRQRFLETAFQHHEEGSYISAIPLFLIQSDGIGKEIFGSSPVSKSNKGSLEKWLSQRIHGRGLKYLEGFLRLIHIRLPITANTDELGAFLNPLNRHAVLHGSDLTYATKRSSLKAVAWLQYVASFAFLKDAHVASASSAPTAK